MSYESITSVYVDENHPFVHEEIADRHSFRLAISEQTDRITFALTLCCRDGNSVRCFDFNAPLHISDGGRRKLLTRPQN